MRTIFLLVMILTGLTFSCKRSEKVSHQQAALNCKTDRDCPKNLWCLDEKCTEKCFDDDDCDDGKYCVERECTNQKPEQK